MIQCRLAAWTLRAQSSSQVPARSLEPRVDERGGELDRSLSLASVNTKRGGNSHGRPTDVHELAQGSPFPFRRKACATTKAFRHA
ncbi:MAG: hypothetical protein AVDCRST_MAG71-2033 [uncultured Lysobacter sp.]|uniref:Uncharacterized protein n=1 Tax=uncultured Lysobacter sp. TaxID=271060 RepID=A0A6J4LL85_9GAMM|nr:MAG: hypothetical protein AVDCRST_MAG71-2033 [uncultured Lysobacter sp.]